MLYLFTCNVTKKNVKYVNKKTPEFENYLGQVYPVDFEIKDSTESLTSAFYLDLLLSIGIGRSSLYFHL